MNNAFLEKVERSRVSTTNEIAAEKKKLAEQYFTPAKVSAIMADMFRALPGQTVSVLDPCCGVGNLSAAVLTRAEREQERAVLTLIEKDGFLAELAKDNFFDIADASVIHSDFFDCFPRLSSYDRIILNPPYSKILAGTDAAKFCFSYLGYKEANIYSAFVACCLRLLSDDGELVAIIPRSFCNGPLFKRFRNNILEGFYLSEMYLFESRKIFWDSDVLQEVLILKISKASSEFVRVSHEKNNGEVFSKEICRDKVYFKGDMQKFIHIPLAAGDDELLNKISRFGNTLLTLGLRASTGKVVDFRCGDWLLEKKSKGSSFLLYQDSVGVDATITFGRGTAGKPRHIKICKESMSVLIPRRNYVLVRRISFKESSTRIVAAPLLEESYSDEYLGVENHLNYIWGETVRLSNNACLALFAYLSTNTIDSYIRRFSGHTQINATDLNSIPIPELAELESFAECNSAMSMSELIAHAEQVFFCDV